jgi:ribonuclease P protein component
MLGRLVQSADFERLRATRPWSRSAHFAIHHLFAAPTRPGPRARPAAPTGPAELSTGLVDTGPEPVDESSPATPDGHWLGVVLPKRLARRSVTRNLLRRQIRSALQRHLAGLQPGLWVVRLRAPFAPADFVSAASTRLRVAAREELDGLLAAGAVARAPTAIGGPVEWRRRPPS